MTLLLVLLKEALRFKFYGIDKLSFWKANYM